ncbi:retrovirus-related pol polyprotein from transposon TNT 1-94 [Tanacetum coccineum]
MAGDEPKKGVTDDASSSQQRKLIPPFDITTLDNPGLVITQVQLKGHNYDEWSRSFRTAIRARKKFGFFDGTIERPGEKDKDIEDGWTINSLLDRILRTVIGAGKRWDGGLFYFREKPLVQALNTTLSISVDLWHKRLGHPPLEVINFLPGVSSSRKDKVISENCEMLTTLSLMFTMMRHIMEPLHKKRGDPLRTGEGSKFVPQDNIPSSSQSPVKEITESPHEEVLGRGCRKKEASLHLRDFVTHTIQKASPFPSSSPAQSWSSATMYPIAHYVNCDKFSMCHRTFLEAIDADREPVTYSQAVKDKRWCDAMDNELHALERNGTWTIENLPKDKKALGCKWVYKIKRKSDGTVERFKARLVILGNHQVAGIDYNETFVQVAKMVTVRVLLAVAAAKKWELHQMDVHNAFLRGDLNEEVFMQLPPGLSVNHPRQAYRLKKSLYGLRQAPRFIFGNDHESIMQFKSYLSSCFHMKDLGILKYFLGVEVARAQDGIFLCQRKYALDIILEVGLLGAKPAKIPIEQNHRLGLAKERLSRILSNIDDLVVRFLKGSPGQGIFLKSMCDLQLRGWCDADSAGCPLTRRSLTGWAVYLGDSPTSWKTKKQHIVSRSSADAEYRSMAITTCELKWLKSVLLNLGIHQHIEVDCHYIRDELVSGNITAQYVSTKEQIADFSLKLLRKAHLKSTLQVGCS